MQAGKLEERLWICRLKQMIGEMFVYPYPAVWLSHFCVQCIHYPLLIELVWSANLAMHFPLANTINFRVCEIVY